MAANTRRIGLSLGADLCWPAAYEELMRRLDLDIEIDGERIRFDVDRVTVEPFDLEGPRKYDVVVDRLTHWFQTTREWIKKITLADGTYVLNNPWSIQANEKHTSYVAMMKLGLPIPRTWMLPPKEYDEDGDWSVTVQRYNKLFDLDGVGASVGYPAFFKPYDGGGWVGVRKVDNAAELKVAYDESGKRVHHLQAGVRDWDLFIRAIGVGPQVNIVKYDPAQPLHARYVVDFGFIDGEGWRRATRICRTINAFFGWDFNSCEMLRADGQLTAIDFANACPDSQVTSLHYHWPWLVRALVRWSVFCAATRRPFRLNLDWDTFLAARNPELDLDAQLDVYDELAKKHFDSDRFDEFCAKHLSHLDEIAVDVFSSPAMREIIRAKVAALYPAHEVESFTDHFFGLVRFWCKTERDRLGLVVP